MRSLKCVLALAIMGATAVAVPAPAFAADPSGVWAPVPGTLSPAGAPQTRRVAVRPFRGVLMLTITYDCGASTPCTSPEVPAVPFSGVTRQWVTAGALPPSAPRPRFVFIWDPGAPCTEPGSRFAATSYVGVWTTTGATEIAQCLGKLIDAPPGLKPQWNVRPPIPSNALPPMYPLPRLVSPFTPPQPQPLPGRKPS